jgi:hypothetical protein
MKMGLFTRRTWSLGVVIGALLLLPGSAAAATASSVGCSVLPVSQPFLSWGDGNWYSLVPGQSTKQFVGTGWTLTGGAKIVTTTRADGSTSSVLDLPSGSTAISPTICVSSSYPKARMMVRDVVGAQGVFVSVSYPGANPQSTGQVHGYASAWTLSTAFSIHSAPVAGWQPARFTLVAGGTTSHFQIYNFYVDPRMI